MLWLSICLLIPLTPEVSQPSEWRLGTTLVFLDWFTLKMETLRFSETSSTVCSSTRRNITIWRQSRNPPPYSAPTVKCGTGVENLTTQETATVWEGFLVDNADTSPYRNVSISTPSWNADRTSHMYQLTWKPLTGWKPTTFKRRPHLSVRHCITHCRQLRLLSDFHENKNRNSWHTTFAQAWIWLYLKGLQQYLPYFPHFVCDFS